MAPPGSRVIAHAKPSTRGSWAPNGRPGWYIDRAKDHYRCYKIIDEKTGHPRISDTIKIFKTTTNNDPVNKMLMDIIQYLKNPTAKPPESLTPQTIKDIKETQKQKDEKTPDYKHKPIIVYN